MGSAGDRPPAGPGRITITFASCSSTRVELLAGEVRVEHRDEGRGIDAAVVVEAPVVVEPQVERAEELVGHAHVVGVEPVDAHAQRREEHRAFDALRIHRAQAASRSRYSSGSGSSSPNFSIGCTLRPLPCSASSFRRAWNEPGLPMGLNVGFGMAAATTLPKMSWRFLPSDTHRTKRLHLVVAVTGEGVLGLVVVVVEVDESVVDRRHGAPLVRRMC